MATDEKTVLGLSQGVAILNEKAAAGFQLQVDGQPGGQVELPSTFCSGGSPVVWGRDAPCVYYHTWFDSHKTDGVLCTVHTVERLFLRGVQDGLELLAAEEGRAVLLAPNDDIALSLEQFEGLPDGYLQRGVCADVKSKVASLVNHITTTENPLPASKDKTRSTSV